MKSLLTFSRETGSMGDQIAKKLAHDLDISYFNREYALKNWLPEIATKHELHMLEESPGNSAENEKYRDERSGENADTPQEEQSLLGTCDRY